MHTNEIHLYVNTPGKTPSHTTIAAALNSLYTSCSRAADNSAYKYQDCTLDLYPASDKVYPAPTSDIPRAIIHIGPGTYREKLVISRPNVTLLGEGDAPEDVVIVYGDGAFDLMPEGDKRGTFRTATVRIDAQDFCARNLTFQNDAGSGYLAGQALALYVDGDRTYFENCRMIGSQDTIFTAPLPEQEFQPGGFKGPGEFKPRTQTRQYYKNCYVEGDVDFIFGSAVAYFEGCTIFSRAREDLKPSATDTKQSPNQQKFPTPIHGYITAASSPESAKYGYIFKDCRLESDCPKASVYLGRPWREFAKTVFLHCYLGAHIHPEGWQDWKKTHGHFYYGEYHSYGPGANPEARVDYSHQLTETDLAAYAPANVLEGWQPM